MIKVGGRGATRIVGGVRGYHFDTFRRGDCVVLRSVLKPDKTSLSKPLEDGSHWQTPFGVFGHNEIIGLKTRSTIVNRHGDKFLLTHPSMEEYILHRMRLAQPIYPHDAAAIVNLADIHIDDGFVDSDETLHYLEAGTGHGSLTLAICRAIHSANVRNADGTVERQGAVLHSIDRNPNHSKVGRRNVQCFRRGMYSNDVQFHVADSPADWLKTQQNMQLSGVFLDLPSPHVGLKTISKTMRLDAPLTVFCPSVSQIQDLSEEINQDADIPLTMITVAELLPGMGGGMRPWDVRSSVVKETGQIARVCRPKVGSKIVGGGFVALFKRIPDGLRKPRFTNQPPKPSPPEQSSWWSRLKSLWKK